MADVKPVALRVVEETFANEVPSPAHDSLTAAGRRAHLEAKPASYLAVTRGPEDLEPGQEMTNEELLQEGADALAKLLEQGAFGPIRPESFYLYQLETPDHVQTAIIANVATQDFADGNVRLHELVQLDRATHLSRHLAVVAAQSSPIALAYRESPALAQVLESVMRAKDPDLTFSGGDGVIQRVWEVPHAQYGVRIEALLRPAPLYLIDGHHRAAAARAHQQAVGDEPSNYILSAIFSSAELRNRAHHRILSLGEGTADFLSRLMERQEVRVVDSDNEAMARKQDEIALWFGGLCYLVTVPFNGHHGTAAYSGGLDNTKLPPVQNRLENLDPVRLQRGIIGPLLGVDGSWSGEQLSYRPGVHTVSELRQDTELNREILCVMRPVMIRDLLDASDEGLVMPPKSTYFEPKARSGVFLRHLNQAP